MPLKKNPHKARKAPARLVDTTDREDDEASRGAVRYTLTSYGTDYPADALVKRIDAGDIYIPGFQRSFVWTYPQASRFIESLIIGLPVPPVFLYRDRKDKYMVVDGQQRLITLAAFFHGHFRNGTPFALKGVSDELGGQTYAALPSQERRRLDNAIVRATIFTQDQPKADASSVYLIFERLNTGGTPLVPQEIRACVSHGAFIDLLGHLATFKEWRLLLGTPPKRFKDQELILRFFGLLHRRQHYSRPMKSFLDGFVEWNRPLDKIDADTLSDEFRDAVSLAVDAVGADVFRPERAVNVALLDALLVGLATRLQGAPVLKVSKLREAAQGLLSEKQFQEWFQRSTTDEKHVNGRIERAIRAFHAVR